MDIINNNQSFAFNESVQIIKKGRNYKLCNAEGSELELVFKVKNCVVKFTPEQYDKITIQLDNHCQSFFKDFESKLREKIATESVMKNGNINLKLESQQQRLLILNSLKRKDYINTSFKFNGIWKIGDKYWISLVLLDFLKVKDGSLTSKTICQFINDD